MGRGVSQPPPYLRQTSFTDHSAENPSLPHEGTSLDAEFNALAVTMAAVLVNLALIQRDDGALKNRSVGLETLTPGVLALINSTTGLSAGEWATATVYTAGSSWVSEGTGTYICAVSHTSGTFATDLASGLWVLIYDAAGSEPADGSVTELKIADGAVTAAKLAITMLDLAGAIRAAGGLSAGTAALGELLAAKKASGDVLGKIERTTRAQGIVGWRIGGGTGGVNWDIGQQADSDSLQLYDGVAIRVSWTAGLMDVAGRIRATGDATPDSGSGIGLRYSTSVGYLDSYNHSGSAWLDLRVRGKDVYLDAGGVNIGKGTSAGFHMPVDGTIGSSSYSLGYRDVPQNAQNGAYTLALADRGKHIYSANSSGQTLTIPANATVAFPTGTAVSIVNRGTNPITVSPASGVTLRQAGTTNTGSRTVAVNGLATLLKVGGDTWFISGAGVS